MTKIGILTFHKSINYGAYMQCYSLATKISNDFPQADVEVINYATQRVMDNYDNSYSSYFFRHFGDNRLTAKNKFKILIKNGIDLFSEPLKLRHLNIRTAAFQTDWNRLPLSSFEYVTDDYQAFFDGIRGIYDVIIVGSDCVWEYLYYPFPNAYFLNGCSNTIKLSFAATSDRMHISQINDFERDYINESLGQFTYIGIRDVSTQRFLHSINRNLEVFHNCDPTVILNISKIPGDLSRIKEILNRAMIDLSKPIIGVMGDDSVGKLVRDVFGNRYKVVAVYSNTKYADIFLPDLTPLEWAKIFSLFAITFTRYFHGTLLAMKNGSPPITLDYHEMIDESHTTKMEDLYLRLGIKDHYFKGRKLYSKEEINIIKKSAERFLREPDSEAIQQALAQEAKYYGSFQKALSKYVNTE